MPSDRRYTNAYSKMANGIQKDAESKLGRPLLDSEANSIRNAGSLMMLESVGMGIDYAKTAEEISAELVEAESGFASRLVDFRNDVKASLESKLNRRLSGSEAELVAQIPNCLVAMLVLHNLEDTSTLSSVTDVLP